MFQTSPLRACAWEQTLFGGSCHDEDMRVSESPAGPASIDPCSGHPTDPQGRTCVCEIRPQPVQRAQAPITPDFVPAMLLDGLINIEADQPVTQYLPMHLLARPAPPSQNSLPLLR